MADFWTETRSVFEGLIEKPKMSEKHLKKPPPKYIYDIVMNVMKKTGLPKGIFTDDEENPKYFESDPKHKLEFLQKIVEFTEVVSDQKFDIKCINILKGDEPEKTNIFLRCFGRLAREKKAQSFVEKYKEFLRKKEPKEKKDNINKDNININKDNININKEYINEGKKWNMRIDRRILRGEGEEENDGRGGKKADLEGIKSHVQSLTRLFCPVGKAVEGIEEEVERMNRELEEWVKENRKYKEKYDEEIKKTDETLLPLQNELLELEDSIKDENMQIKSIKSRLIKNERVIHNLITNVISFKSE